MSYTLRLEDSQTSQDFELLEIPIKDTDIEGASDSTTLSGDIFTDYLYLKKEWRFHWAYMDAQDYQDLRGFYTRQFARNVYPRMTVLDTTITTEREIQTEDIYTGELIAFERGIRINNLEIYGKTEQATTTGKNLVGIADFASTTKNGITASATGGVISINGTASATAYFEAGNMNRITQDGAYTISIKVIEGTWTSGIVGVRARAGTTTQIWYMQKTTSQASATRTLTGVQVGDAIDLFINGGSVLSNCKLMIQVEAGSTATDYEPYTAGPSPNPTYPQEVKSVTGLVQLKAEGVNIFDPNKLTDVNAIHYYGGGVLQVYTTSGNYNRAAQDVTDIVKAHPGQSLNASMESVTRDLSGGSIVELVTTYSDGTATAYNTLISEAGEARTITIPTKSAAIQKSELRFFANNSSTSRTGQLTITNLMLQIGTAKPYQPPLHSVTELNFGKNLFDKANVAVFNGYFTTTNLVRENANARMVLIKIEPGATYTWSTGNPSIMKVDSAYGILKSFPADNSPVLNKTITGNTVDRITFTAPEGAAYLAIYCAWAQEVTQIVQTWQLERGDHATSYAAYKTPIELRKIGDAQDRLYRDQLTRQWYIERQVWSVDISDASQTWAANDYATRKRVYRAIEQFGATGKYANQHTTNNLIATPAICPRFINTSVDDILNNKQPQAIGISSSNTISVQDLSTATSTDLVNEIKAVPTPVYYILEVPFTEPLTDWELITQLESALIYPKDDLARASGTVKVESSNGLTTQITANITTYGYEYLPTPIVENVTGRLKLTDGGVVDNCSGREDIELIIRESNQ